MSHASIGINLGTCPVSASSTPFNQCFFYNDLDAVIRSMPLVFGVYTQLSTYVPGPDVSQFTGKMPCNWLLRLHHMLTASGAIPREFEERVYSIGSSSLVLNQPQSRCTMFYLIMYKAMQALILSPSLICLFSSPCFYHCLDFPL